MDVSGSFSMDFCRVVELTGASGSRWVCYRRSRKPDMYLVGVTNGFEVWENDVSLTCTSRSTDLTKLRPDDIKLSLNGNTVYLNLGPNESYMLQKVADAESSTELAAAMLFVSERCSKLECRLAEAERTIESLKRSATSNASAHASVFDMAVDNKKFKTQTKIQPKQAGMSILNPGSRKRGVAKGVQFD